MDWLGIGDYDYTTLGSGISDEQLYVTCDFCSGYCAPCENFCWCDEDRPHDYAVVLVQAVGFPIATAPTDTTFRIRGWRNPRIHEDDAYPAIFNVVPPSIDLVFEATVDPRDMDHRHVETLKPYMSALLDVKAATDVEFKGAKSKKAYIGAFKDRVQTYFASKDRQADQGPPHVGRRKKGHSHVKV